MTRTAQIPADVFAAHEATGLCVAELNVLTRKASVYPTFEAMVRDASSYRPTLRADLGFAALADAYDAARAHQGDARRAYRGG